MGETKTFLGSIVSAKYSRLIGVSAAAVLFAISALVLVPVCKSQDDTFAAPTPSTTTLAMTTPSVSLSLALDDAAGTFAVSDPASFSVTTNNYTGYALSIRAKEDNANNSKLINGSYALNSISSATADGTGFSVGDWGYKPSKLNSADNTDFLPAPTYAGSVLNTTTTANSTADNYSLALAAKADYATASGTYENTFVLSAVGNPVNYTITYDKNTTDTVTNMPATQIGTLGGTDVIISSQTPTRSNYVFIGWCNTVTINTDGVDNCSGTSYIPSSTAATSMQTANTFVLRAMWGSIYTISYNLNNGTASGNPTSYDYTTPSFTLNNPTRSGYTFAGWTGTGIATISRSVTVPQGSTGDRNYTANWCLNEKLFTYSGAVEPYTIPQYCSGSYQLEAWGAEGGTGAYGSYQGIGGKGGYSEGTLSLQANTPLYIAVGGKGNSLSSVGTIAGGFNGGGSTKLIGYSTSAFAGGSGGGATSIAYINGTIGDGLTADTANQVLLVAGGGAGGVCYYRDKADKAWIQLAGAHGGGDSACNGTGCGSYGTRGGLAAVQSSNWSSDPIHSRGSSFTTRVAIMGAGGGYHAYAVIGNTGNASTSSGGYGLNNITDGTMQSGIRSGHGQAKITLKSLSD